MFCSISFQSISLNVYLNKSKNLKKNHQNKPKLSCLFALSKASVWQKLDYKKPADLFQNIDCCGSYFSWQDPNISCTWWLPIGLNRVNNKTQLGIVMLSGTGLSALFSLTCLSL